MMQWYHFKLNKITQDENNNESMDIYIDTVASPEEDAVNPGGVRVLERSPTGEPWLADLPTSNECLWEGYVRVSTAINTARDPDKSERLARRLVKASY